MRGEKLYGCKIFARFVIATYKLGRCKTTVRASLVGKIKLRMRPGFVVSPWRNEFSYFFSNIIIIITTVAATFSSTTLRPRFEERKRSAANIQRKLELGIYWDICIDVDNNTIPSSHGTNE